MQIVSYIRICTAAYCCQHCAAHGRSFLILRNINFRFITFAMIFFHSGLLAPPPQILVLWSWSPRPLQLPGNHEVRKQHLQYSLCHVCSCAVHGHPKNTPLALWDYYEVNVLPSNMEGRIPWFSPSFLNWSLLCWVKSFSLEESPQTTICYRKLHWACIPSDDSFPSAWTKRMKCVIFVHTKVLLEIKTVPDVPREILHWLSSPTVPVPTAAAALSPAPATTLHSHWIQALSQLSGFRSSNHSQPHTVSEAAPLWYGRSKHLFWPAAILHIKKKHAGSMETSVQKDPLKRYAR